MHAERDSDKTGKCMVQAFSGRLATASSVKYIMHCALFIQHVNQFVVYSLHTKNNSEMYSITGTWNSITM